MSLLPDWLTGYDEENALRAQEADRRLRKMGLSNYDQASDYDPANQRAQIDHAFTDQLYRGPNIFRKLLGETLWAILAAVPAIVWIGGAVALFWWLGGFTWAKRAIAKA